MNGYVMETRQVTKTYGSFLALDHVNIHVRKGCIYGLVGDNGAGKSTLLKLLAGQSFPTEGEIEILGKHGLKDLENVRKQMGCMIEQPGFFPNMTVEQTLKYYCIQKGIPDKGRILEEAHLKVEQIFSHILCGSWETSLLWNVFSSTCFKMEDGTQSLCSRSR